MKRHVLCCVLALGMLVGIQVRAAGSDSPRALPVPPPNTDVKTHTIGNLRLAVSNWGTFGTAGGTMLIPWSLEFPAESEQDYLFLAGLWIGAVVNGDTFVSVGFPAWSSEFFPGPSPEDTIVQRSNSKLSPYFHPDAVSEQDLICVYTDTVRDPYAPPDHVPLEIRVTQDSYCWSGYWVEDLVLLRLQIENIRDDEATLEEIYTAIYFDGDVVPVTDNSMCQWAASQDDITGFRRWLHDSDSLWPSGSTIYEWDGSQYVAVDVGWTPKYRSPCDQPGLAWIADDDGFHPDSFCPETDPALSAVGVRPISLPQERLSYQWWVSEDSWGPHDPGDPGDPAGTPTDDSARYVFISSGRVDPDQVCDDVEYPPGIDSINDTRYLISVGPHELAFGETLEVVWAFVGGERFHDGRSWCEWEFADLIMNGNRAYAVYDNPGIDTDGDGYFGDYMIIDDDTLYLTGDGVPDYEERDYPPWNPCDMIVGIEVGAPEVDLRAFGLRQNFPNPFSEFTRFSFSVPVQSHVDLDVFDVCGRRVACIVDEKLRRGSHLYDWNGVDDEGNRLAGGVYFARLSTDGVTQTGKVILLR